MFNIKKHSYPRQLNIKVWDQQLYDLFFSEKEEQDCGHYWSFMLTERDSTLAHGQSVQHYYHGNYRVCPTHIKNEYCDISVDLSFYERGSDFLIEETPFGYADFGWSGIGNDRKPSIALHVRETGMLSEQLSLLFTETKACGGQGVKVVININIKNMLGLDAKAVWGDWESSADDDENLPGRKKFPFGSLEFCASLK